MKLDARPILIGLTLFASSLPAQKLDPVQWTLTSDVTKAPPGSIVPLKLTAKLEPGWHLYSLTTPPGGPIPTTAVIADNPSVEKAILYQPKPERRLDPNFGVDTETFANEAAFWVTAELKKDAPPGAVELEAQVRYQSCDDRRCLPPRKKTAKFTLNVDSSAAAPAALVVPAGYTEIKPGAPVSPVQTSQQTAPPATTLPKQSDGLTGFLLGAFGLGLASIFTPCVFPMIPVTVSFFLNQRGGIAQAAVFSSGIIVLFCAMGLGVTAAVGPFGVVQLGSNPWVNGFIAIVFCAFALSLLGAFEITLPSGLVDQARSSLAPGWVLRHAADGLHLRPDFLRLCRTFRRQSARGLCADQGNSTHARHGELRGRVVRSLLLPGCVSFLLEETPP